MSSKNRMSISFSDSDLAALVRFKNGNQASIAETVRVIVHEYIKEHPNRFRLTTEIESREKEERISRTRLGATIQKTIIK